MAEVVGSTATSTVPVAVQDIVFELRVLQLLLAIGLNIPDELQRIRAEVRTEVSSTFTA